MIKTISAIDLYKLERGFHDVYSGDSHIYYLMGVNRAEFVTDNLEYFIKRNRGDANTKDYLKWLAEKYSGKDWIEAKAYAESLDERNLDALHIRVCEKDMYLDYEAEWEAEIDLEVMELYQLSNKATMAQATLNEYTDWAIKSGLIDKYQDVFKPRTTSWMKLQLGRKNYHWEDVAELEINFDAIRDDRCINELYNYNRWGYSADWIAWLDQPADFTPEEKTDFERHDLNVNELYPV